MASTMRRRSLTRRTRGSLRAARPHQPRRADAHRRGTVGACREAAPKTLLEVSEVREHDLARAIVVVSADSLDKLFVRLLGRASGLLVAQVADRRYQQLAIRLDRGLEDLIAC